MSQGLLQPCHGTVYWVEETSRNLKAGRLRRELIRPVVKGERW